MSNQALINKGLSLLTQLNPNRADNISNTAVSSTTILQRYDANNSLLRAFLMASKVEEEQNGYQDVLQIYRKMEPHFNLSDLQTLSFELGVNFEDINGQNRLEKLREFLIYIDQRGKLNDLIEKCKEARPQISWLPPKRDKTEAAVRSKLDMAVVIDVARPALKNVATYLDDQNLDVNFVVFRHAEPGKFFTTEDDWQSLGVTFGDVMARVKREFEGVKLHFFLAGPGGLLFAMGCIWGTVDDALVYHYENNTYHPVLPITRALRETLSGWN